MTTNTNYYADTAYDSTRIPPQKPVENKGVLKKLLSVGQTPFPFHQADSSVPRALYFETTPSELKEKEAELKGDPLYWNEESVFMVTMTGWALAYLNISALASLVVQYFTPFAAILVILASILDSITFPWSWTFNEFFPTYAQYIFLPCLLIWGQFELCNRGYWVPRYFKWLLKIRKSFELNRRTGMVTLYKKHNKVRFSHPFIELDCILLSTPNHQGIIMSRTLVLAHRYSSSRFSVPVSKLIGSSEMPSEYRLLWNMIQRYMDINKPLPDTLVLEPSRERDPTTAEFDKRTKRPPRYWRDMSDREYEIEVSQRIQIQKLGNPLVGNRALDIFEVS